MNRLTNGKKRFKKKEPRLANQMNKTWAILKPIMNSRTKNSSRLSLKNIIRYKRPRLEYKAKTGIGLRLKNINVFLLLFVCFFSLLILSNRSNIMAYFTEIKHLANVFSVNAGYTITFNSNSGTGSMPEQTISYNVATALTSNSYTRTGYTFTGWNTSADGNGTPYSNGQSVTNIGDTTLFAQWDRLPVKYAVQIYGINEDKDSSGNPLGLTFGPATGDNYNNKYITHTYEDNGDGTYDVIIVTHTVASDGTETTTTENLTDSNGDNVTRTTAEKNKCDINLHSMTWAQIAAVADKTAFLDCMLCGDTKSVNVKLDSTIRSGNNYTQNGDGAGIIYSAIDAYYRRWNPSSEDNLAAINGGNNGSNGKDVGGYKSSHMRATLIGENNDTDITYAGNENLSASTSLYSSLDSDLRSVITAKSIKYVTGTSSSNYDLNEDIADNIWLFSDRETYGTGEYSGQTSEGLGTSGDGYSKYKNAESRYYMPSHLMGEVSQRVCYCEEPVTVGWWFRSVNLDTTTELRGSSYLGNISDYSAGNFFFGLAFGFCIDGTPVNYTVNYNSNGGSGTMTAQTMTSNQQAALKTNAFTRSGYVFTGWNTAADGSGTSYADEQVVYRLATSQGATVNLYAQWEKGPTKYAVQIYGINEDVDENDNPLGLTFGPAIGDNFNNKYVTHTYEDNGDGTYNVIIVTHTVASNGTETTITENLLDSNGDNVTRTTADKNKYDINMHEMTWTQIAAVADKTAFLDCMLCGDTKSIVLNLNNDLSSGNSYDQYGDGAGTIYNSINPYYLKWNPNSTDNAAATVGGVYSSNAKNEKGYSSSHIRATLIGADVSNPTVSYAGDVNLNLSNSLYSCIESDLRGLITPKKVKYVTGYVGNYTLNDDISDEIWLYSKREVFGTGTYSGITTEGVGSSGVGYSKFSNQESKYYMSAYSDAASVNRVCYNEFGTDYSWWLRSPYLDSTGTSYCVKETGIFYNNIAYGSNGLSFGFCIDSAPVTYTVRYNSNGGSDTMADQPMQSNEYARLTANAYTRSGYKFTGWNTAANGSGTSYTDEQFVRKLSTTQGAVVELYAQWEQVTEVKYAVQIYGINQDVDANDNTLGLTFGPATGDDYNNKYVTHTYEETSNGSGVYYVKIVTHTVAANGSETTSESYLQNSSGNNVTRTTEDKNKYDINIHNMTWTEIAQVADKTSFLDCMLCGDTKSVMISLNSTIGSGKTFNQYGDGAGVLKSSIDDYYNQWNISGGNAKNDGGYSSSHIRATLVGQDSKTNVSYAGNNNLTTNTCLYSCIESDLKNIITSKKVKYITGTSLSSYSLNDDISDKIWLLSEREIYGTGDNSGQTLEGIGAIGNGYSKFGNTESKYYMSSYNNNSSSSRECYYEGNGLYDCFLRSIDLSNTKNVFNTNSGSIYYGNAPLKFGDGITFGFCIE